jgi:hypothetical protein
MLSSLFSLGVFWSSIYASCPDLRMGFFGDSEFHPCFDSYKFSLSSKLDMLFNPMDSNPRSSISLMLASS